MSVLFTRLGAVAKLYLLLSRPAKAAPTLGHKPLLSKQFCIFDEAVTASGFAERSPPKYRVRFVLSVLIDGALHEGSPLVLRSLRSRPLATTSC